VSTKLELRTRRAAARIGKQLRSARLEARLSQQSLAEKIGMTRTNYARLEQGRTNVTLETLLRIADGLGLDLRVELVDRPRRSSG
jgi:transcriptional regulator with XRE-family HTH domain